MGDERTPDEVYLDGIISAPTETRKLEFKTASSQYSYDKALKYCAALANEGGGKLVLGVTDKVPRLVPGTAAFSNIQEVEHKIHVKLGLRVLIEERTYEGKRVLVFNTPARSPGTPVHVDGAYFMRSGESLVPMTPDQLRTIFNEGHGHFTGRAALSGLNHEEALALLDISAFYRLAELPLATDTRDKIARLSSWGLIRLAEDDSASVTNLGALLFANDLDQFGDLKHRRLRITKYSGLSKIHAVSDHFENRGYAASFKASLDLIKALVPVNEEIKESFRIEVPLYPEVALRELLVNMFAHQDFDQHGSQLSVELYDDRLEMTNPGRPLIDVSRFVDDNHSRNKDLSSALLQLRMGETRGSGIDRALNELEAHQVAAPEFHTGTGSTRVVLFGRRKFEQMTTQERCWNAYLHCCLKYTVHSQLTNSSLRNRFGLPPAKAPAVSLVISEAIKLGFIKLDPRAPRATKSARYIPAFAS
jgi:ATP-dependent DNA helicase RecG